LPALKNVIIIGSGFAGLSAACFLARSGFKVQVLEKNDQPGGRARVFEKEGFTFDMGPSWYWMPDVFERFFQQFGSSVAEHYQLKRLDPSYRVYFGPDDYFDVPADWKKLAEAFENWEPGAARNLEKFLSEAEIKYREGIGNLVFKPGQSVFEFCNWTTIKGALQLDLFSNFKKHVTQYFHHPRILKILEFPVLFLGATPEKTPALYSLMNFADIKLGTWYPQFGMGQIVKGMVSVAESLGVEFLYKEVVLAIEVNSGGKASKVVTANREYSADVVVANADYAHVDQNLLRPDFRTYSPEYWKSRVMAPSSLLYYVGVKGRVKNLVHHNLFFDEEFALHAHEIYQEPKWPTKPLFYLSAPSVTDRSLAPEGCENLFFLIPTAPGLMDDQQVLDSYFQLLADKTRQLTGNDILENLIMKVPYGPRNFVQDYHAHKGNAYGLANTLMQTALLKPSLKSKKVSNLYFTGQLTVPGPGVPPALISGEVVAAEILKQFQP
jgi:phytoene desaturase